MPGGLTSSEEQPERALRERDQELGDATERIGRLVLECRGSAIDAHADLARVLGERERQLRDAATRIAQLQSELARIHGSRFWRMASVVWALRRWIGRRLRPGKAPPEPSGR